MIPLLDIGRQNEELSTDLSAAFFRTMKRSSFTLSREVEEFEEEFAAFCGASYAVGVGSGTDALFLALKAIGVADGDEIITAPNSFIATAEAISMCGATPVFVDIKPDTYNIDPDLIEAEITSRTRAIVPVHLYGLPAEMDAINGIAKAHGLRVIEDACQAHGAEYKGTRVGAIGDAGAFSFYPGKNLGAMGDGGIVVTNDPVIAESIRLLRHHGQAEKNFHLVKGYCSRLHGLQAAVLQAKIVHADGWSARRRRHAAHYIDRLASLDDLALPQDDSGHVYHLYVVRTPQRDRLAEQLDVLGISTGIHYPTPIHLQPSYGELGHGPGDFPVAESAAREILSLPMFPQLSGDEVETVCSGVEEVLAGVNQGQYDIASGA